MNPDGSHAELLADAAAQVLRQARSRGNRKLWTQGRGVAHYWSQAGGITNNRIIRVVRCIWIQSFVYEFISCDQWYHQLLVLC